jgi:malonyl-CoA decarboxylase
VISATTVFNDLVGRVADRGRSLLGSAAPGNISQMCETLLTGKGEATGLALARGIFDRYDAMTQAERHVFFIMPLPNGKTMAMRPCADCTRPPNPGRKN